jgi:hypothetical protein
MAGIPKIVLDIARAKSDAFGQNLESLTRKIKEESRKNEL